MWRLILAIVFSFVLFLIFKVSGSWGVTVASGAFLFCVWILIANFMEIVRGKSLKMFLKTIARDVEVSEDGDLLKGNLIFQGNIFTVVLNVTGEGVFIYCLGVCSCVIPWDEISFVNAYGSKGVRKAQLKFKKGLDSQMRISWLNEFQACVPSHVAYFSQK
ncbi:hypothetical protein ACJJIE_04760 [Microbulbifer sp. TRSA001]|uniref:hypothetical protein n=1 Tax=Microbulbifer sp. TRSA001 TaxID=3243381 RepID=UPI0040399857